MIIIPAIDLRNGKCVRLTEGRKDQSTTYDASPLETAKEFADGGAEWLHIVDLDGAFGNGQSPNRAIVREIVSRVGVPVQFGGGLRTIGDVEQLIAAGVARVVLGTIAVESPSDLSQLVRRFGDRVCVGIDAQNGQVMTRGWERGTKISAIDLARRVAAAGVSRVVYTDISRDGTLKGVNIVQTCELARQTGLRVTASGGVASCEDLRKMVSLAEPLLDSVIIGKALYEKRFTLKQAIEAAGEL